MPNHPQRLTSDVLHRRHPHKQHPPFRRSGRYHQMVKHHLSIRRLRPRRPRERETDSRTHQNLARSEGRALSILRSIGRISHSGPIPRLYRRLSLRIKRHTLGAPMELHDLNLARRFLPIKSGHETPDQNRLRRVRSDLIKGIKTTPLHEPDPKHGQGE